MNENLNAPKDKKWKFCIKCGQELPEIANLRYCIKCGTKILNFMENKNKHIDITSRYQQPKNIQLQFGEYKLSDDEIYDIKNHKLWGIGASILIPIASLFAMVGISTIFIVIYILMNFDLSQINIESISNITDSIYLDNNFIIMLSILELIFIIIPVLYIRKYIQKPSIKKGLALLGFTSKGFSNKDIAKEIGLGLLFAVIGVVMVLSISLLMELLFPSVEPSEFDALLFSSLNVFQLVLYILTMIFIVGTSEEILFRGFMQKGLIRSKLGVKGGIILSAFIFAMIHVVFFLYDFDYFFISFIPYFFISLLLGWLYYWRNENLIAVMITHGVYDALTLIIFFFI